MPSGSTHAAITTLAAAGLFGWGYLTGQPQYILYSLPAGCLAGVLLSPDLDVNEPTYSYHVVKARAGSLVARAWYLIWMPYGRLIRHRSWISHFPIFSTLIRIAYLGVIAWGILFLFGKPWPWSQIPPWLPWAVAGLMVSDALHWAADMLWSQVKRTFRL